MSKATKLNTVTLSKPIKIDRKDVTEITLRKPSTGELRGLAMTDVLWMDVSAMLNLLPRVTQPPLSLAQLSTEVDLADFNDMAGKTLFFFMTKQQQADRMPELEATL